MNRHYFLSGNTSEGFYSFFDDLPRGKNMVYIIKGGPGTGKSTTMKHLAQWAQEEGHEVEYIHCSSDPDSLDGVILPKKGIAMMDGTAPHVMDPKYPGAREMILDMGAFFDVSGLRANRQQIIELGHSIANNYDDAYRYLGAAGEIYRMLQKRKDASLSDDWYGAAAKDILRKHLLLHNIAGTGRVRGLFSQGITPKGVMSFADQMQMENAYVVPCDVGADVTPLMQHLCTEALQRGFLVQRCHDVLSPKHGINGIIVPELQLSVFACHQYSPGEFEGAVVLDIAQTADETELFTTLDDLVQSAVRQITSAKRTHDDLEKIYTENVDFAKMEQLREGVIAQMKQL